MGIRYFDIRPVIHAAHFYTGHYGDVGGAIGWQGGNGEKIASIVDGINQFTSESNELIILRVSHSLDTDNGYHEFSQEQWNNLFSELNRINFLKEFNGDARDSLMHVTLDTLYENKPSVLIIFDANIKLGEYKNKGFYNSTSLDTYDSYSNTDDLSKMISDQVNKMKEYTPEEYFLLSWTLTENGFSAATCTESIKELADSANEVLEKAYEFSTGAHCPNILYIDNVLDAKSAAISLAITRYLNIYGKS